jgi:hypothetical protein
MRYYIKSCGSSYKCNALGSIQEEEHQGQEEYPRYNEIPYHSSCLYYIPNQNRNMVLQENLRGSKMMNTDLITSYLDIFSNS